MGSTTSIRDKLYKLVEINLSKSSIKKAYNKLLSDFVNKRSEYLYDNLPCNRLPFLEGDVADFFKAIDIDKSTATEAIKETYYGDIKQFRPIAAKDEFTVTQLMVIRYYLLKNDKNNLKLSMIYLAFSGKFYPSIHYSSYPYLPNKQVMEYVVNYQLSNKYDLTSTGSIIGSIENICNTWISTYGSKLKKGSDEDIVYIIQQLHSRIGSFMKNIATIYYKEYENSKSIITYDSDNFEEDNYHLADSDSLKMQRAIESASNRISSSSVDYRICKMASDENIRPNELSSIINSILCNPDNNALIRELLNLIVTSYYSNYNKKDKDVRDISFITYSISPKPNAKQKEIIRQKEIIEKLLLENSNAYARRRSRIATKNSYEKAVLMYFVIIIHDSNR